MSKVIRVGDKTYEQINSERGNKTIPDFIAELVENKSKKSNRESSEFITLLRDIKRAVDNLNSQGGSTEKDKVLKSVIAIFKMLQEDMRGLLVRANLMLNYHYKDENSFAVKSAIRKEVSNKMELGIDGIIEPMLRSFKKAKTNEKDNRK